jgi:rhamnosyltransferase
MIDSILRIMVYDFENKQLKLWACLLGTYHGLIGKLTKKW